MRWGLGVGAVVAAGLLAVVVHQEPHDSRTKKLGSDEPSWSIPVIDQAEASTIHGEAAPKKMARYGWRRGRTWRDRMKADSTTTRGDSPAPKLPVAQDGAASSAAQFDKAAEARQPNGLSAIEPTGSVAAIIPPTVERPIIPYPVVDELGIVWRFSRVADRYMMEGEATVAQFSRCVAAGACKERKPTGAVVFLCTTSEAEDIAADCVSGVNARRFCRWVGGRLPTEKAWQAELTSSGTEDAPWGNAPASCEVTNALLNGVPEYSDARPTWCLGESASPPCSVVADLSDSGICDLGGNLAEWVGDGTHVRGLPSDFETPYGFGRRGTVSGLVGVRCTARYSGLRNPRGYEAAGFGRTGKNSPAAAN